MWECKRHVGWGGVVSKLQKKLIKNEKKGTEGGEERREWTEAVVGRQRGERERGKQEKKERRGRYERREAVFY